MNNNYYQILRSFPLGLKIIIIYVILARVLMQITFIPNYLDQELNSAYLIGPFIVNNITFTFFNIIFIVLFVISLVEIFIKKGLSCNFLKYTVSIRLADRLLKLIFLFISPPFRETFYELNFNVNPFSPKYNEALSMDLFQNISVFGGLLINIFIATAILLYLPKLKENI